MGKKEPALNWKIVCVGPDSVEQEAIRELLRELNSEGEVGSAPSIDSFAARVEAGETASLILVIDSAAAEAGEGWMANLRARLPGLRVAIYGNFDDYAVQTWLPQGVDALIERATPPREVLETVSFVLAGNRYISPGLILAAKRSAPPCTLMATCGWRSFLLEDLPVGLMIIQGERFIYVNAAAKNLFGLTDEEVGRSRFWDRVVEDKRQEVRELCLAWQRGAPVVSRMTVPVYVADGSTVPVELFSQLTRIAGAPAIVAICAPTIESWEKHNLQEKTAVAMAAQRPSLTQRQNDILALLAGGASNKEIARRLSLSEATVKLHVHRILRVLGGKNRTEAAYLARTLGLLDR
ncbi:MAG: LuxR C-terminal-related transcriptional regulator [Pseudomonadota bacterium]